MALSKGLIKKLKTLFPQPPEYIEGITEVFEETRVFIDDDVKKGYELLISGYNIKYNFDTKQFEKKPILDLSKITQTFLIMNKTALEADRNCRIDEPEQQENIFEFDESEVLDDEEEVNPDVEA